MQKTIGVFDSGIGGQTTAQEIQRLLPDATIFYYGDHDHCPYGGRSQDELIEITTKIVANLVRQGTQLIVIACNTATTQCIHALRKRFPQITFVGTEPAIKVACNAGCQNILLMATPATVKSAQVQRLIAKNITHQEISLLPCPGLANLVENTPLNELVTNPKIITRLDDLLLSVPHREMIDGVVLGCTHYIYLKQVIQKYFPNAQLFDGNLGVAKRVKDLLNQL